MTIASTEAPKSDRLKRAEKRAEREENGVDLPEPHADDFTTADERLAYFWQRSKYRNAEVKFTSTTEARAHEVGETTVFSFTVHVTITIHATDESPARHVAASATRSSSDRNEIAAGYPHETAETAALSRALRFLGIKLNPRSK